MNVCSILEIKWKNKGSRFLGVFGKRQKLWLSRNSCGIERVEVLD